MLKEKRKAPLSLGVASLFSLSYYSPIQELRLNNQITAPTLRVIDEKNGNLGIMPLKEALAAAEERELDLILIVPNASPPVAKIISFDKFRYEREKDLKKQRQAQKTLEMKQIQISVREAKNDLLTKIRKLEKFLETGHKLEIVVTLRGREKGMKDFAKVKLEDFLGMITTPYNITQEIKAAGRGLNVQIIKK